jgi:hypothetical protein
MSREAPDWPSPGVANISQMEDDTMKQLLAVAAAAVLALGPVACSNQSPEGGTPGTNSTFKLSGPTIKPSIKQGDTETVKVSVNRDKNFHQTVNLDVKAPDKIKADLDRTTVKDGESTDLNLKINPAADAPPGDHTITITGKPESGQSTTLQVTVNVTQK